MVYLPSFAQHISPLPARAKWQAVLAGNPVCPPQMTSYGFAVLLDARMICTFTENGTSYWTRQVIGKPDPYLTVTDDDFIYTVSQKKKITLYNPSGSMLWSADCEQNITAPPLAGWDRRVFAAGISSLSCYGLDGTRKFYISTGENHTGFPLFSLPDGSLLLLQKKEISQATTALRISPYGEILEEIVFTGRVSTASQADQGVILGFADGTVGCCSAVDNSAATVWIIQQPDRSENPYPVQAAADGKLFFILYSDSYLAAYEDSFASPNLIQTVHVPEIDPLSTQYFTSFRSTCTIIDTKTAVSVRTSGDIDWKYSLLRSAAGSRNTRTDSVAADRSAITDIASGGAGSGVGSVGSTSSAASLQRDGSFCSYTSEGHFLLFPGDWSVQAYRLKQYMKSSTITAAFQTAPSASAQPAMKNPLRLTESNAQPLAQRPYPLSYQKKTLSPFTVEQASSYYRKGNYGSLEQSCIEVLNSELLKIEEYYLNDRRDMMEIYSRFDASARNMVIYTAGLTGTSSYIRRLAHIIERETDPSYLITALAAARNTAYDPDHVLLESIASILRGTNMKNYQILTAACDAVYSICRYMGKPAIFTRGKEILTSLMYSYIDSGVRSYARKTLLAVAELEK